eukprot:1329198-Amorphochlora_amoeboformis.AAC.1
MDWVLEGRSVVNGGPVPLNTPMLNVLAMAVPAVSVPAVPAPMPMPVPVPVPMPIPVPVHSIGEGPRVRPREMHAIGILAPIGGATVGFALRASIGLGRTGSRTGTATHAGAGAQHPRG